MFLSALFQEAGRHRFISTPKREQSRAKKDLNIPRDKNFACQLLRSRDLLVMMNRDAEHRTNSQEKARD